MTPFRYFLFFCGQVGMMSLARFLYGWILKYGDWEDASETKLFPPLIIGLVYLAFRIFDGITDPLAGKLSDSWVRSGRQRRHLLWFSFALAPLGLLLTFLPVHSMPPAMAWALLALGMFLFFIGYTFYAIPYWSLVDDYSAGDPVRRARLSNLLGGGIVVASGLGFVVSGILIEKYGFATAAACFGVFSLFLMALPFFGAPPDSLEAKPHDAGDEPPPSLWAGMRIALTHRRFLALLALFGGSQMSFTIMTAAAAYIAEDLLGGTKEDVGLLLGPLLGVAVPFFLAVPWVLKRFGWMRGMLIASVALSGVYAASGLVGQGIIGSPFLTAAIIFGLGGPMIAVLLGLEAEGVVDCAEERGGGQMVGAYWGVFNFVVKILNGFAFLFAALLARWQDSAGDIAIRSMSFLAGGCLLAGVLVYFAIRPEQGNGSEQS